MAKTPEWQYSQSAEAQYRRQLRKVADHSGDIVDAYTDEDGNITDVDAMVASASLYAEAITPWANKVAQTMINSVAKSNERYWKANSEKISIGLQQVFQTGSIAPQLQAMQAENVALIKSLPTQAAQRAKDLSQEAVTTGARADEVARQILDTKSVTKSRADLIARTEVAKTNGNITKARAKLVGASKYIWRTMEDGAVRPSHAAVANEIFDFNTPPAIEGEGNHGPADYPNCRCYAEVIITQ